MTGDGQLLIAPERVAQAQAKSRAWSTELRRVILGKEQTIDEVVAALLARGHVLLEGLPGLGKTELVKALSRLLSLDFRRIQFTPDLLPTDITGSHILQEREGRKEFVFHPGPVFTNVLLADEINRASPKTQAALLEAMQERRVTTFGETRPLPDPFFVLATQNPIELEGTYPASRGAARSVHVQGRHRRRRACRCSRRSSSLACTANRRRSNRCSPPATCTTFSRWSTPCTCREVSPVTSRGSWPRRIRHAPTHRRPSATFVKYGSSPRAAISIGAAARGLALLRGKPNVGFDEVRRVAAPAMAHRLVLDYAARLEGWDGRRVVAALLEAIPEIERGLPQTLEAR